VPALRPSSTKGNLKTWTITPGPQGWEGWVTLICQSCFNPAPVHHQNWLNESEYGTRPCTYCFKTAKIPEENDVPDA
jgi:hypothetical protein